VRARNINLEMMSAVSTALAELARLPVDNAVITKYNSDFKFGKN